jgi:tRNA(Glu) U13 pseudouridine synthase TruD
LPGGFQFLGNDFVVPIRGVTSVEDLRKADEVILRGGFEDYFFGFLG